jgi:HEAT repeat protein
MRSVLAILAALLLSVRVSTVEAPAAIRNARIETSSDLTPSSALERIGKGSTPEWVGWSVPAIPEARGVCCFSDHFKRHECSLGGSDEGWGTTNEYETRSATEMYVLVAVENGRPSRVKIVAPTCSVEGRNRRLVWLGEIAPAVSISALERLLDAKGKDEIEEPALAAIAYHVDPRADAVLEKRAFDRSLSADARQHAIFWAGNARGEAGYKLIERVLATESDGDLRQHATFALTQSPVPAAADRIKRVAVEDRDADVRAQALFWLSQTKSPGAGDWIVGRLDAERDDHVREQAVFALSQLPDGTDWLLKVLRSNRNTETVRQALFWLGQSEDPRALEELEKILDR